MAKKEKRLYKRIIAGEFKNKPILLPPLQTTRSSKGIVLESFFNTVQFSIVDSVFVEVFSGSGSVGLEALSRGARKIIFMERDKEALRILRQNVDTLNPKRCEIVSGDSFINIESVLKALKREQEKAFFYIDPPFQYREGFKDIYNKTLDLIAAIPLESVRLVAVEHMSRVDFPQTVGNFTKKKTKKFGKTALSYYDVE